MSLDLLFQAIRGETPEVARLLDEGADPNFSHSMLWSASVSSLLKVGEDHGYSAQLLEAWRRIATRQRAQTEFDRRRNALLLAVEYARYDTVVLLLDRGADPNAGDDTGMTSLLVAVLRNDLNIARALLRAGADPRTRTTESQKSPLLLAARAGNLPMVELLIAAGADVNAPEAAGITPLMVAASAGEARSFQIDRDFIRIVNDLPPVPKVERQDDRVASLLIHRGAQVSTIITGDMISEGYTALHFAALRGNVALMRQLIEAGAPVEVSAGTMAGTPLGSAVSSGNREAVELLLAHGAEINSASSGSGTPLMCAASHGFIDLMNFLIDRGAWIDSPTPMPGGTPLIAAAGQGELEAVKVLLARGADVNGRSDKGTTALIRAASPGHADVVAYLIQAGADIHARNAEGKTAFDIVSDNAKMERILAMRRTWEETVEETIGKTLSGVDEQFKAEGKPLSPKSRSNVETNMRSSLAGMLPQIKAMHDKMDERIERFQSGRKAVLELLKAAGAESGAGG